MQWVLSLSEGGSLTGFAFLHGTSVLVVYYSGMEYSIDSKIIEGVNLLQGSKC